MRRATAFPEIVTFSQATWLRGRKVLLAAAVAGWSLAVLGFAADPQRFALSYLVAFLFVVSLGLGALFFVMVQHLSGAVWSVSLRRIAENIMATLPAAALLFVPVALNLHHIYEWTHTDAVAADPVLQGKRPYLNTPFFLLRAVAILLLWAVLSRLLRGWSLAQDRDPDNPRLRPPTRLSAVGLVFTILTVTVAAFDWIMSLEPHWYSTVLGVYFYTGAAVGFLAALILVLLGLRRAGYLEREVHVEHYHDLGKWLFGLVVFWAYIAFSQYMLIWYANLPEETAWFRTRTQGGWLPWAVLLALGHFVAPFFALLSRGAKRNLRWLGLVSAWVIAIHYLDLYWQVMPALHRSGPQWHWMDAAALVAVTSTAGLLFWSYGRYQALAPAGDSRLARSLEFHNV